MLFAKYFESLNESLKSNFDAGEMGENVFVFPLTKEGCRASTRLPGI